MVTTKDGQLMFDEFLKELKEAPSPKLLTDPIKNVVEKKISKSIDVEIVAMQILLAIKFNDDKVLEKNYGLDSKVLKSKLSRSITKPLIKTILEAISVLEKLKTTPKDYLPVLKIIRDGFILVQEGKQELKKEETVKEYKNEHLKEVLAQFESNQSFVYLLGLVNRAYAPELFTARVNKIIASLEILASIRETGDNKYVEFGAITIDDLRNAMKGSLSLEVATICYQAAQALNERTNEISETTPALIAKIKELKQRFEHIVNNLRES